MEEDATNGVEDEEKVHLEESLEKEIESKKEEGMIESTVSVSVRAKEEVFVKEEMIEASTTRKSTQEKVETAISPSAAELSTSAVELDSMKKKRTFRKFSYRGVDLDQLLDLSVTQVLVDPFRDGGLLLRGPKN